VSLPRFNGFDFFFLLFRVRPLGKSERVFGSEVRHLPSDTHGLRQRKGKNGKQQKEKEEIKEKKSTAGHVLGVGNRSRSCN
jgi:hypothetical protein